MTTICFIVLGLALAVWGSIMTVREQHRINSHHRRRKGD